MATLLSYGWGADGLAEAIQFITQGADGTYRWDTMLYSGFGLGAPTDAVSVLINGDEATFYSGPGASYEPVATVFGGQTVPVLGVSDDIVNDTEIVVAELLGNAVRHAAPLSGGEQASLGGEPLPQAEAGGSLGSPPPARVTIDEFTPPRPRPPATAS